jgi:hypothetical protein
MGRPDKKAVEISKPIYDLVNILSKISDRIDPYDEIPTVSKSLIHSNKSQAILTILFGEQPDFKKRGNKSFEENDKAEILKIKDDPNNGGLGTEEIIRLAMKKARVKSPDTDKESLRNRIYKVYSKYEKIGWYDHDYSNYTDDAFDRFIFDDVAELSPWLDQYKAQILQYYELKSKK